MSLRFGDANAAPAHVLFPAEYRASCRMIARDFALLGGAIVVGVVGLALLF